MSRLERVKQAMRAVELLKEQKHRRTYESLAKETGLPITVLNRYVKGRVLPNADKTQKIIALYEKGLKDEVKSKVLKFHDVVNNMDLLSDVELLDAVAKTVASEFNDIDLVVTTEDGLPFATLLAHEIGAKLSYLLERKKLGVEDYLEINIFNEKGSARPLYLPKSLCTKRTRTLFVDDIIRTGSSACAVLQTLSECSRLQGGFIIVSIGGDGRKKAEKICPIRAFVELK